MMEPIEQMKEKLTEKVVTEYIEWTALQMQKDAYLQNLFTDHLPITMFQY